MLTQSGLHRSMLIFLAAAVLTYLIGWNASAGCFLLAVVIYYGLSISLGSYTAPPKAYRVFSGSMKDKKELHEFLKNNDACAHALHYATHLPPRDLLKFVRLIIESRYGHDQECLTEIARVVNSDLNKED